MRHRNVLNTIPHNLTGRQVLDLCFDLFNHNEREIVWILIPRGQQESFVRKMRVALSKERKRLEGYASPADVKRARQFTLEFSKEVALLDSYTEAMSVRLKRTRRHYRNMRIAAFLEKQRPLSW